MAPPEISELRQGTGLQGGRESDGHLVPDACCGAGRPTECAQASGGFFAGAEGARSDPVLQQGGRGRVQNLSRGFSPATTLQQLKSSGGGGTAERRPRGQQGPPDVCPRPAPGLSPPPHPPHAGPRGPSQRGAGREAGSAVQRSRVAIAVLGFLPKIRARLPTPDTGVPLTSPRP